MITAERLRELLHYDPETGVLTWLVNRGKAKVGSAAGYLRTDGYRHICIGDKLYYAHHLAWLYMTGAWPPSQIDHIDGARDNNRWVNLRTATQSENQRNSRRRRDNTTGVKGVSWDANGRKWYSRIKINGRTIHLGRFASLDAAAAAYAAASEKYHGEYGRTS